MKHTLTFPNELKNKLEDAFLDSTIKDDWANIGINSVDEMIQRIVSEINKYNPKIIIRDYSFEDEKDIKERVENCGTKSLFNGYFENENGNIDALFFYIEPKMDSANDFLTRQVIPSILGIYKSISSRTKDLHINNMPIYIVNLCTTGRITQDSVKKTIVCTESMGFNYIDIFKNDYRSVINLLDSDGKPVDKISTLHNLNSFLTYKGVNEYFEIDEPNVNIKILGQRLSNSSNVTAELYRYAIRVIPAVYFASVERYTIDISDLSGINSDRVEVLKEYIENLKLSGGN